MNCLEALYSGDVILAEAKATGPKERAILLSNAGRHEEAYAELIGLDNKDCETYIALISILRSQNKPYGHLIHHVDTDDDAGMTITASEMYADSGMLTEAIVVMRDVLLRYNVPHLRVILAKYLLDDGFFNEAVTELTECITDFPTHLPAYVNLYNLVDLKLDNPHINFIKDAIHSIALPEHIILSLHGVLGIAYEKAGKFTEAFEYYKTMYSTKRKHFPYNVLGQIKALASNLSGAYPQGLIDNVDVPEADSPMIFVCGMPRSGTTLVEQILVTHKDIGTLGETQNVANKIFELADKLNNPVFTESLPKHQYEIGDAFVKEAIKDCKHKRIVDKMPQNFLYLGAIYQLMPTAKVVFVRRNPMDNCFSCLTTNFAEGHEYSYSPQEMAEYYVLHNKIMKHWQSVLPASFLYEIRYEELVADFDVEAKKLMNFIGLEYEKQQVDFHKTKRAVKTASVAQVNKPLYASSVNRAQKFKPHLENMESALNDTK